MSFIPKPDELFGPEARTAFYVLLSEIRDAETERELLLYVERAYEGERLWREMVTLVDAEIVRKFREFCEKAEQTHPEPIRSEAIGD